MTNEFWEAIQPGPPPPTREVAHPHFYQHVHEQEKLKQQARNMTRQQLFDNGFITVEDLDDEELRLGRCRDGHGRIPHVTKTMEMVPRDLYDEMVAEHLHRTKEKYRQNLDAALQVMVDIMGDESVEPKDRMEAAKHIIERQMGKAVERVNVSVTKAPWEELLGDVAHITRAQHQALKEGAIDVESFELPGVPTDGPDVRAADEEAVPRFEFPETPTPFAPVPAAPSFDNLAGSNPVGPKTLSPTSFSQVVREATTDAEAIAEARAHRRKLIDDAKRKRKAQRATGADVLRRKVPADDMAKAQERLGDTQREEGDSG